ncbi:hypothetical protein [Brucella anthropi]|uniref:hypothetical protein n=1 Tax=Brucella anthropi TaxID=529 RepID=UPI00124C049B|nr:hypothetical protein [Brucella anthropi]KAB2752342.1 hypothetical protein F9L05_04305 [Brucella anthropi]
MRKLGPKQAQMLRDIVKTNGGGISGHLLDQRVMRALENKGLIQGKLNQPSVAVHTRAGLEWVRQSGGEQCLK